MKKKLFVSTHVLELGGVERSFIAFLEHLDYEMFEVDVFLYKHGGALFHLLPKEVNLLPEKKEYAQLLQPIFVALKTRNSGVLLTKILGNTKAKIKALVVKGNPQKLDSFAHVYLNEYASKFLSPISDKTYDAALAFLHPNFCEAKIKAKKHFAWVHTDYSNLNIDKDLELKMWKHYDHIFAVSEQTAESFKNIFPEINNRVEVLENMLSKQTILSQKNEDVSSEMPKYKDKLIFLSIGRFMQAKNFDNIPDISKLLLDKGLNFKWYIIGFGADEEKILKKIEHTKTEQFVKILGKKSNPYPYIQQCDFYIQPSIFEGKAVTVQEAQLLGKPVIITNYPSSKSQIKNNWDGIIVPIDNVSCAEEIFNFVKNKAKVSEIIKHIKATNYDNPQPMLTFKKLL